MKETSWTSFFIRSIILGVILAMVLLVFVPELRSSKNNQWAFWEHQDVLEEKISYNKAIASALPSVVSIYSESFGVRRSYNRSQAIQKYSLGSGIIVDKEGYILTCYHVIANGENIMVSMTDGRIMSAQIVGTDRLTDLAVLKIEADNLPVIRQSLDNEPKVGDVVMSIGNPYNVGQSVSVGIVSQVPEKIEQAYAKMLQTDAVMNTGSSGGALIDSNGNLIGINTYNFKQQISARIRKDVAGIYYALSYSEAYHVMRQLIDYGKVTRGSIGISTEQPIRPINATTYIAESGSQITGFSPNSSAANAGLQVNDIIYAIDGVELKNQAEARDKVTRSKPGTVLTLSIIRNEQLMDIPVTVEEMSVPQ